MPSKRADRRRNVDKVAGVVFKKPLATVREIAKEVGVHHKTVENVMPEVRQNSPKDERIRSIVDSDMSLVAKGLRILHRKFDDPEVVESMRPSEVSSVIKDSAARASIFGGDVTDEKGGLKLNVDEIKRANPQQLFDALRAAGIGSKE